MKRHDATAAAAVLAALLAWAPSAQAARAYIGTYTPESATVTSDNHGEGI